MNVVEARRLHEAAGRQAARYRVQLRAAERELRRELGRLEEADARVVRCAGCGELLYARRGDRHLPGSVDRHRCPSPRGGRSVLEHPTFEMREARELVWIRCRGCCEACGGLLQPHAWECHHRRLRGQGGPDCPCNLLALHRRCHNQHRESVHDRPRRSRDRGLIVSAWADPRETPVLIVRGRPVHHELQVLLTCDGRYGEPLAPTPLSP